MFKKTLISLAVASSVTLTGCIGTESGDNEESTNSSGNASQTGVTWPIFDPGAGALPIPSDLNFDQEAGDGSFGVSGDMTNPVIAALNEISGASTVAPAVIRFNGEIDPSSVDSRAFIENPAYVDPATTPAELPVIPNPSQNVFLIELEYASGATVRGLSAQEPPTIPLAITFQVAAGMDPLSNGGFDLSGRDQAAAAGHLVSLEASPRYDHDVVELDGTSAIRIRPLQPLNPLTRYVAVVTDGVTAADGETPIAQAPVYEFLTETTSLSPLEYENDVPPALDAVGRLVNLLWETIGTNYFGLNNAVRTELSLPALSAENIALSYSFTTSADKEVLSYIGNSANWISDQLERATKFGAASLRVKAAKVFSAVATGEPTGIDPESLGLEETATDAEVIAAVITALGKDPATDSVEVSDFMAPGRTDPSEFGYGDVAYYVGVAAATFTPSELNSDLAPCDGASESTPVFGFTSKFDCSGALIESSLDTGLAASGLSLQEPEARTFDIDSTTDALQVSSILSQLDIEKGEVDVHQGSITLPQYIAVPDATQTGETSTIRTQSWRPNATIAGVIGSSLGVEVPQADTETSTVLNYNYPFPAQQEDVEVPMLVITPAGADPRVGGSDLLPVIFQHGITTDRSAALTFGSQLVASAQEAGINIALFAIDQPLHGVSPFTAQEQQNLAITLLAGAGIIPAPTEEDEDGNPVPPTGTQDTIDAVIDGTFKFGAVLQIQAELDAANPSGAPNLGITDPNDPAQLQAAITSVLAGDAGADAQDTMEDAITLEGTVANAGSTIAGLAPANTATGWQDGETNERHYGFTVGSDNNPIAMNFETGVGSSGSLFINLTNFANSRDILRQGAVDLMNLTATVNGMDGIDGNGVVFIGHSLGTLNGAAFVGASTASGNADLFLRGTHLLTPVAGVTRLLENSPSFAPTILGGLQQAAGLTQGDANLETFLNVNQATIDAVDPINFADELAVSNVVLAQIALDRTTPNAADSRYEEGLGAPYTGNLGPLDITFPNGLNVESFTAPLSGSEALAAVMGAEATGSPLSFPSITRYAEGVHSTPVLPLEEVAEAPDSNGYDVLKNRTIATGGEVIVSDTDAEATFSTMIGQTIALIMATAP